MSIVESSEARARHLAKKRAYYEANRECILAKQRAYREANPEIGRARSRAYREANLESIRAKDRARPRKADPKRAAYIKHKCNTKKRGIPFLLTFEEWLKIWEDSGHFHERGVRHGLGQYVMARHGGDGAFTVGNVIIIPRSEDLSDYLDPEPFSESDTLKRAGKRAYRKKHRERSLAMERASHARHRERRNAAPRSWREANRERFNARQREQQRINRRTLDGWLASAIGRAKARAKKMVSRLTSRLRIWPFQLSAPCSGLSLPLAAEAVAIRASIGSTTTQRLAI
jgi:hypothetical protein